MELLLQDNRKAISVSETIFSLSFNESLVHQVVTAYKAYSHQGTRAQKSRAQVSGSGKKMWRQKGTGRARAGCAKSPIWRSGGVTFAASPKNYEQKVNRKMYRKAMKVILSELIRQNRLIAIKSFHIERPKTKLLVSKLTQMSLKSSVLIFTNPLETNLTLAARNLSKVRVCSLSNINPVDLIVFSKILMTENVIKKLEEDLA